MSLLVSRMISWAQSAQLPPKSLSTLLRYGWPPLAAFEVVCSCLLERKQDAESGGGEQVLVSAVDAVENCKLGIFGVDSRAFERRERSCLQAPLWNTRLTKIHSVEATTERQHGICPALSYQFRVPKQLFHARFNCATTSPVHVRNIRGERGREACIFNDCIANAFPPPARGAACVGQRRWAKGSETVVVRAPRALVP